MDYELYFDGEDNEFDNNDFEDQSVSLKNFDSYSLTSMDLSTELICSWYKYGKLVLDPEFQRRNVWDVKKMSRFIESLILGMPTPSILLADDKKNNRFLVIDGKQRLNAIVEFISHNSNGKGFKLKGLEVLTFLNGYNYYKLIQDGNNVEFLSRLQNSTIKGAVIKNYSIDLLYFIFNRLNTGSVPLSTQELRQSLYPGKFLRFVNEFSNQNPNIMKVLHISTPDKRMKDSELVIRYFAFKYFRETYSNNLNQFFNTTCERLNNLWESNELRIKEDAQLLNESIQFVYAQAGDEAAFRVYFFDEETGIGKFGPINRPMYDLLTVVFSDLKNRELLSHSSYDLKSLIIKLFTENTKFKEAFEPTTHSKEKTEARFEIFLNELNNL